MTLHIVYILLLSTLGDINSDNQSRFVKLSVSGGESALETFYRIFYDLKAEIISQRYEWTEGPVILPRNSQNPNNDILLFSDTIQDKIWIYEESENKPHNQPIVLMENSGNCKSARSDCQLVAEPGSNGLAINNINKNLLICQHGARAISKLPLSQSNNMPIANSLEVSSSKTSKSKPP